MKTILVTGASGFIGSHLVRKLVLGGRRVRAVLRKPSGLSPAEDRDGLLEQVVVRDIRSYSGWEDILDGVDAVVHLAGLAHDVGEKRSWTPEDYAAVNVQTTEKIARAAARAGVRRFVYISSIKTLGEETPRESPFDEQSPMNPENHYSSSKRDAELALRKVADETGLEVVIIRPPLVYGPGVKGNMGRLVQAVRSRRVIPVPAVKNLRSFVYVGNLVDMITVCLDHPAAAGRAFVVNDGRDVSTAELVKRIADSLGRRVVILPIPWAFFTLAGKAGDAIQKITGRASMFNSAAMEKIRNSLRVNPAGTMETLGWSPRHTMESGINDMTRRMRNEAPRAAWLNVYDFLAVPAAWLAASVVRYDYFLVTGGLERFLFLLPVVMAAQYVVYKLTGFSGRAPRARGALDISRAALLGVLAVAVSLFLVNRLHGVSRTALVLYPLFLVFLLALPRLSRRMERERKQAALDGGVFETDAGAMDEADPLPAEAQAVETMDEAGASAPKPGARATDVSVIIVNYNAGELLTECVRSVLSSNVAVEVIVSDNGSTDGSVQYLRKRFGRDPRLRIIGNNANLGFARANNAVLPYASGRYMLFLNPDCVIEPDTIERMERLMDSRPEAGMAGCLIKNLDGSEQAGCRRMVPTPWRTFTRIFHLDKMFPNNPRFRSFVLVNQPLPPEPVYIEALSGAFMFVRREALEQVGPLDEAYFMHCEDLDWCMRFRKAGWAIMFAPDVEITHVKGTCSRERPLNVLWHKHRGMVRFYRTFFRHQYPVPFMWLVVASVWARFATIAAAHFLTAGRPETENNDIN